MIAFVAGAGLIVLLALASLAASWVDRRRHPTTFWPFD